MIKLLLLSMTLFFTTAFATDIKQKTIEVVIPFPPGGGVDLAYRHFEKYAATQGLRTVPIYKPGADGLIGMRDLDTGARDGSRISFATSAIFYTSTQKDPSLQITPITGIRNPIAGIVVSANSPITTIDQLVNTIKANDRINIGSGSPGQTLHWIQLFELMQAPQRQLVTYKGSPQLISDILGGHIDVGLVPISLIDQHVKNGKLRILAHGASSKLSEFPQSVPFTRKFPNWRGLDLFVAVSPIMDAKTTEQWNSIFKQYLSDPGSIAVFEKEYSSPLPFGTTSVQDSIRILNDLYPKLPK